MLLLREIKVLRRLSQQDFSGGELAKQLKASRRTIVGKSTLFRTVC